MFLKVGEHSLLRLGFGLEVTVSKSEIKHVSRGVYLDDDAEILGRKPVAEHALDEQSENFVVDQNLVCFGEVRPCESEQLGLRRKD